MTLLKKCYSFTRAEEVKEAGIYPYFRPINENEGPVVHMDGKEVIMAGSNNYLGLTAHERVKEAAIKAVNKYGTSCSGSRYLTGTIDLHIELEAKLAKFMNKEACLLFSTGYQTAQGVISTLIRKGDYILSDKDNHASIVAGNIIASGQGANVIRYKHNDVKDLERVLQKIPINASKLIVSDGVFSALGDITPLSEIKNLAKHYHANLLIDDAHALGVIGTGGRGTASEFNCEQDVDMIMTTFSKTLASLGGYVVGKERVINYLKHHSSALIFSASPTPPSVAAASAALDILIEEPHRVSTLAKNAQIIRDGLTKAGFQVTPGKTAIVPVIIGNDEKAFKMWKELFDNGVFVNVFISPAAPHGKQMLRTSYMATHNEQHLQYIIDTFIKVGNKLGII